MNGQPPRSGNCSCHASPGCCLGCLVVVGLVVLALTLIPGVCASLGLAP